MLAIRPALLLARLSGVKISEVAQLDAIGVDRALVAQRAIEAYLIQVKSRSGGFSCIRRTTQAVPLSASPLCRGALLSCARGSVSTSSFGRWDPSLLLVPDVSHSVC